MRWGTDDPDVHVDINYRFTVTYLTVTRHCRHKCCGWDNMYVRLDTDSYLSGWKAVGLYYKRLSRHLLMSWSIFVISCHSSGALGDEAVCCGLMETRLIPRLNDPSWLGGWFHLKVHLSTAVLGWSPQPTCFICQVTGWESSSSSSSQYRQYLCEFVWDIIALFV